MFDYILYLKINIQSFKRTLNRKVEKTINKQSCLENLASVLNNRYNTSDSDQDDSNNDYKDGDDNSMNVEINEEGSENMHCMMKI